MEKITSTKTCGLLTRHKELLLRIMKRSQFLLLILFNVSAFAFSQKISVNLGKVTLSEALKKISAEADVDFFYSDEVLDVTKIVRVNFRDMEVSSIIERLVGSDYYVEKEGDGLILIIPMWELDQERIIVKGRVVDENGLGLPGVTVLNEKEREGVSTDFDGNYEIDVLEDAELTFSYLGYITQKITVKGQKEINISLVPDVSQLSEVVVTGIVDRNKETYTGSTTTIKSDQLLEVGNQNVIESIRALDPSFVILENNIQGSNPNVLPTIEIRGKTSVSSEALRDEFGTDPNSPLFILNGFETDLRTITDLDINLVESITIMKDAASTAMYGSRAANGVVVVETKKPKGGRVIVAYAGNFNVEFPDLSDYNLMNAEEKLEFERLSGVYTYDATQAWQMEMDSVYNSKLAEIKRGVNTYWLNEPVRTAFTQGHTVNISGGTEKLIFNSSINYKNVEGVMKGSGRDNWGAMLGLNYLAGKVKFTNTLRINGSKSKESPYGDFSDYAYANPYYRKYNELGGIDKYLEEMVAYGYFSYDITNPLYQTTLNNYDGTDLFELTNNFGAIWDISPSFRFNTNIQLRKQSTTTETYISPLAASFDNTVIEEKGSYTNRQQELFSYTANAMLTYFNTFGKDHTITGSLRSEISEVNNESYSTKAIGFPAGVNGIPSFANSYEIYGKPSYATRVYRRNNITALGHYGYKNKYLVDATYRLDGSTAFGSNKKYSPFWSVGFGWNIHKELGIEGKTINSLRLTQTFGETGNQNLGSVASISVYNYDNLTNYFGSGVGLTTLANPNLEWQKTFDMNFALLATMFDNRFDANLQLYRKKTDPLVVPVNLAASSGLNAYPLNVGALEVNGFEATLRYAIINNMEKGLVWRVGLTTAIVNSEYSGFNNLLDDLNKEELESGSFRRYIDGNDPDAIWAVRSMGIDPATGREVFLKKDGSTTFIYDASDEVVVGNLRPDAEGVISTNFYFKSFNFGARLRYRFGGQVFNTALWGKVENISRADALLNQDRRALYDRWQQPGDIAKFKAISISETTPPSSRFVQDENVLIGESFNLGYQLSNKAFLQHLGMSSLSFTAYMNDIFRISTVEVERGISYPFARSVSFSINASF
ncbi:SusC/RagA family TonB-linked outer membrane protein [Robertkochia solimangrovi]|uniref:SusC/RagA family TonB-linked outer membrane protein n=1 Tax=Robertkochia solimangrovi TaxID=2213046 RepID=UPI00117C40FF|nr:SusC/RagA family TonB-linked outer membrane protein [Robertkochia solimangrovi]TRZ43504.1 SusC/RagA family TonB-linked outer membrane protein [Robertkochia solimangrovi]